MREPALRAMILAGAGAFALTLAAGMAVAGSGHRGDCGLAGDERLAQADTSLDRAPGASDRDDVDRDDMRRDRGRDDDSGDGATGGTGR